MPIAACPIVLKDFSRAVPKRTASVGDCQAEDAKAIKASAYQFYSPSTSSITVLARSGSNYKFLLATFRNRAAVLKASLQLHGKLHSDGRSFKAMPRNTEHAARLTR